MAALYECLCELYLVWLQASATEGICYMGLDRNGKAFGDVTMQHIF